MSHVLVKLHIGCGETRDGIALSHAQVESTKEALLRMMSQYFGGATLDFVTGAWIDTNGKLILERSMVIESITRITDNLPPCSNDPPTFKTVEGFAHTVAQYALANLNQQSVLVTIQRLFISFVEA